MLEDRIKELIELTIQELLEEITYEVRFGRIKEAIVDRINRGLDLAAELEEQTDAAHREGYEEGLLDGEEQAYEHAKDDILREFNVHCKEYSTSYDKCDLCENKFMCWTEK